MKSYFYKCSKCNSDLERIEETAKWYCTTCSATPECIIQGPTGIGDVNSTEVGSAARYNKGKLPLHLIPIEQLYYYAKQILDVNELSFFGAFAAWQRKQRTAESLLNYLTIDNMENGARVFEYGAEKYAAWNWTKGMPYSAVTASLLRHLWAITIHREKDDPESGLPHWGHVACNVMMLVHYENNYPEGDDRPNIWRGDDDE